MRDLSFYSENLYCAEESKYGIILPRRDSTITDKECQKNVEEKVEKRRKRMGIDK
jgi:hypothetical protein